MKAGDLFIYNCSFYGTCELEFKCVNKYGNFEFHKTWNHEFPVWVWLESELHLLVPKDVYNSPLMKALR